MVSEAAMDAAVVFLLYMVLLLAPLLVGCIVVDYIFPHIGPLERYLESLPMMDDDENGSTVGSYPHYTKNETKKQDAKEAERCESLRPSSGGRSRCSLRKPD